MTDSQSSLVPRKISLKFHGVGPKDTSFKKFVPIIPSTCTNAHKIRYATCQVTNHSDPQGRVPSSAYYEHPPSQRPPKVTKRHQVTNHSDSQGRVPSSTYYEHPPRPPRVQNKHPTASGHLKELGSTG